MYYANYIANSEISNNINTKHRILKGKSTSKRCIADFIEIHSVKYVGYRDTPHYGLLATESPRSFCNISLSTLTKINIPRNGDRN